MNVTVLVAIIVLIGIMLFYAYVLFKWDQIVEYIPCCLGVLYSISVLACAAVLLGDPHEWKGYCTIGIASFGLVCYVAKLLLNSKSAGVGLTLCYSELKNGRRVCFISLRNILEIIIPILYCLLVFAYVKRNDAYNRHMGKGIVLYVSEVKEVVKWSLIKYWTKMAILSCGAILAIKSAWRVYYYRVVEGQNEPVPMETIDQRPRGWNEVILQDSAEATNMPRWEPEMVMAVHYYIGVARIAAESYFRSRGFPI